MPSEKISDILFFKILYYSKISTGYVVLRNIEGPCYKTKETTGKTPKTTKEEKNEVCSTMLKFGKRFDDGVQDR